MMVNKRGQAIFILCIAFSVMTEIYMKNSAVIFIEFFFYCYPKGEIFENSYFHAK